MEAARIWASGRRMIRWLRVGAMSAFTSSGVTYVRPSAAARTREGHESVVRDQMLYFLQLPLATHELGDLDG